MPMSTRDGRRVTSVDGYLASAADQPPNLTVRPDSFAAEVVVKRGPATAVRLADGTEIAAGWIVLAAGTYGSPPILMRSGIGPAEHLRSHGIRVAVDLPGVGANLADHPATELDSGRRGTARPGPAYHSIATFRSSLADGPGPDLMIWVTDPEGEEPAFFLDPVLLKPDSRGTVRLRATDPMDPPRITLPGLREPRDVDRLVEGYLRGLEVAHNPELRRLADGSPPAADRDPAALRRRVVEGSYSLPHVVGTCRMGPSPEGGDVVDALGRVHGVERLSVIDASVIPNPPSGFPHIVTIMLAEHLAGQMPALL
jgi:choline dehydrogenase